MSRVWLVVTLAAVAWQAWATGGPGALVSLGRETVSLPPPPRPNCRTSHQRVRRKAASQLLASALKEAPRISEAMQQAEAYRKIAAVQAAAGDTVGARRTLELAYASAPRISEPLRREQAFVETAKALLAVGDTACACRSLKMAEVAASQMSKGDVLTELAYDEIIKTFREVAKTETEAGDKKSALETLKTAKATVAKLEEYGKVGAYCEIAKSQAKAGSKADARETLETLKALAARPENRDADGFIVGVLEALGDFDGAKSLARRMRYEQYTSGAFLNIAEKQAASGDLPGAKATASEIGDQWDKTFALMGIAPIEAKAGHTAEARATIEKAKAAAALVTDKFYGGDSRKWEALRKVATVQVGIGDLAGAKATAEQIGDKHWKWYAYCDIVEAQAKHGDTAGARETMKTVKAIGRETARDDKGKGLTYQRLAEVQVKAGDTTGARETAAPIRDDGWRGGHTAPSSWPNWTPGTWPKP